MRHAMPRSKEFYRFGLVIALEPSLEEELRMGRISVDTGLRRALGEDRVPMNLEVAPWVKETFAEEAERTNLTLAECLTWLALLLRETGG